MKTRYKILIISIVIISIIWFLLSPSFFGQPECSSCELIEDDFMICPDDYDCALWNNWEWIYSSIFVGDDSYPPPVNKSEPETGSDIDQS